MEGKGMNFLRKIIVIFLSISYGFFISTWTCALGFDYTAPLQLGLIFYISSMILTIYIIVID